MISYLFPLLMFFGGFVCAWGMATACARWRHTDDLRRIEARHRRELAALAIRKMYEGAQKARLLAKGHFITKS